MGLPAGTVIFDGDGQLGNWADPMNWSGGVAATLRSIVLIPMSTTLNDNFVVRQLMMLGDESVTVNAALTTRGIGPCTSFMVCEGATATFTPASSLTVGGGIIVGDDAFGALVAQGNATSHSTLTSVDAKIGEDSNGIGSITIDGAQWRDSYNFYVGLAGQGTLDVLHGGSVTIGADLVVGDLAGSSGSVDLSSGARLSVGTYVKIGGGHPDAQGGTGSVTVGAGSLFAIGGALKIASTSSLTLAGGTVAVADSRLGVQVWTGAHVSGFGTLSAAAAGINDAGTITATGGTLTIDGSLWGNGQVQIGNDSTLVLDTALLGRVGITFGGSGGTLDLAHGVRSGAVISGFASGDTIAMAGVDHIAWNGETDVLTLSQAGTTVDTLQFAGIYSADPFTLTQSSAGALISLKS